MQTDWGGRRNLPFIYTFKGVCYIISRLRLNLAQDVIDYLLKIFNAEELLVFDYGYDRPEENIELLFDKIFKNIDKIEKHFPIILNDEKFYIDFLFTKYKIAIEIDEYHHTWNTKNDIKRQEFIENLKGYQFIRIKDTDDYFNKVNEILSIILLKEREK